MDRFSLISSYFIAFVWLMNGLFCKILNLVPRHQEIVARILATEYARELTFAIGLGEVFIAVWTLIGIKKRLNAMLQIALILMMNAIEFILVPDLLLWGRWNVLFALLFVGLIYYTFIFQKKN